jgi:hypothetical protein
MPALILLIAALVAASAVAQPPVVRTADPAKRGLKDSDFPRTIKVAENVYTYPSDWLKALDRAEAMNAGVYIAGHGFTKTGPVSKEELRAYRKALAAVIAEATRLHKAGVPVDEAVNQAKWGEYGSWTLAASQGPIAVRRVYEELDGKLK